MSGPLALSRMRSPMLGNAASVLHSTVRIACNGKDGSQSIGTGFTYGILENENNQGLPAIITNKHVIEGATEGHFFLTVDDGLGNPNFGKYVSVTLKNFSEIWLPHPNPEVDLAACMVGGLFNQMEAEGCQVFARCLTKRLIPTPQQLTELSAIEDIVMIGYPSGIWDKSNNIPLVRRGITSTPPYLDYEGRKEFMIDAACFPGSSGSPVFILNQAFYSDRMGTIVPTNRVLLLGILYAGPQYTAEGHIVIVDAPTVQRPVSLSSVPMNLGLCLKAERLLDFEKVVLERGWGAPQAVSK